MSFIPLLIANLLPTGLPLHKGATWTWEITDRSTGTQILRTATAVDSTTNDSGAIWTLSVKDSTNDTGGSAKLRVYPDGGQGWVKPDIKLNWDLEPWTATTPTLGGWGHAFFGEPPNYAPQSVVTTSVVDPDSSTRQVRTIKWTTDLNLMWEQTAVPWSHWTSTHGMLAYQHADITWKLLSHDGVALDIPGDSLVIPAVGSNWTWSETSKQGTRKFSWQVLAQDPDSSGWVRLEILRRTYSYTSPDNLDTSATFPLRLNPRTGQRIPARTTPLDPDEAWWLRLGDSSLTMGKWRGYYAANGSGYSRPSRSHNAQYLWMLPQHIIAHQAQFKETYSINTSASGSWNCSRTLTSINGVAVTAQSLALSPASSPKRSFATLARLHPATSVRWRDAQGRGGLLPASALISVNGAASRIVFVDAVFPDGSTWKGSILTSTNPGH